MERIIKEILADAIHAPSGHNAQPWEFRLEKSGTLTLFNIPERDQTVYNYKQRGSLVAHGALLENITIAAQTRGYKTNVTLTPDSSHPNATASVFFEKASPQEHPLYSAIFTRATNRKAYQVKPLESEIKAKILNSVSDFPGTVSFIEQEDEKKKLAQIFTINERLLFENYAMHESLFPHILWNEEENKKKKLGLYIKTFELAPPAEFMFRLFKYWWLARAFGVFGFGKVIAKQNAQLYASTAAIGLIAMPDTTTKSFIYAGRILQRMWLTATTLHLSVQPVTAMLYLGERVHDNNAAEFTPAQKKLIEKGYGTIQQIFGVDKEAMMMTFRIGYDEKPSAYSEYKNVEFQAIQM